MKQILTRLSMLTSMRDELRDQIVAMGEVDCSSPAFRALDDAIKCLDAHHISRLRVSLDVGSEVPLSQWVTALELGGPMLTHAQANALLRNAMNKAQLSFNSIIAPVIVEELEEST